MVKLFDRVRVNVPTTGTGDIEFGAAASTAFLTPAESGVLDGDEVRYVIVDGLDFEEGVGLIKDSVATMERTVTRSKIGGVVGTTKLNLGGTASLGLIASAADILTPDDNLASLEDADAAITNLGGSVVGKAVFTAVDAGAARGNLGVGILAGFRNKIINGNFAIWQRATSQTSGGYGADDMWRNECSGTTQAVSRQAFALGQTDVPGEPEFFSRTIVSSVSGSNNFCVKIQRIEDVRTLAGKMVTLTFYAKADAAKNIAVSLDQSFGSGGSPSLLVAGAGTTCALTTSWRRFDIVTTLGSLTGKTLGSNDDDYVGVNFWFDAGSSFDDRTGSLGQQSGTFDIARVSLDEGDTLYESDPFEPRHIAHELIMCQRYFESIPRLDLHVGGTPASTRSIVYPFQVRKRAAPTVTVGSSVNGTIVVSNAEPGYFRLSTSDGVGSQSAAINIAIDAGI